MRRSTILSLMITPLLGALLAGGCTPDSRRLNEERQRRIRAESWIRKAERALNSCKQHIHRLQRQGYGSGSSCRTRVAALQRQLAYVRNQMNAKNRRIYAQTREIQRLQLQIRTLRFRARGPGAVRILAVKRYRGWLSAALRTRLFKVPAGILACYRSHLLTKPAVSKGAFWVILGTHHTGVIGVDAGAKRMGTSNQRAFRRCVATYVRRQRSWRTSKPARFALLLAYAPRATELKTLPRPAFRWPWKPLGRGHYAKQGQICRVGRRFLRGSGALNPHQARPCAPGLKCCYPCGVPGCNSVCLKDCGPPRP